MSQDKLIIAAFLLRLGGQRKIAGVRAPGPQVEEEGEKQEAWEDRVHDSFP
jgi:hypothetical protein